MAQNWDPKLFCGETEAGVVNIGIVEKLDGEKVAEWEEGGGNPQSLEGGTGRAYDSLTDQETEAKALQGPRRWNAGPKPPNVLGKVGVQGSGTPSSKMPSSDGDGAQAVVGHSHVALGLARLLGASGPALPHQTRASGPGCIAGGAEALQHLFAPLLQPHHSTAVSIGLVGVAKRLGA